MTEIEMVAWDDFHAHFRDTGPNGLLPRVSGFTTAYCDRALVMPNTNPAIVTAAYVRAYDDAVCAYVPDICFRPIMSIKLLSALSGVPVYTTPEIVREARATGALAGKLYPVGKGGTTGAMHEGVDLDRLEEMFPVFAAMQDVGMVLCLHGEVPTADPRSAEQKFLPVADRIVAAFPGLHIVFEHVSSAEGVAWVRKAPSTVAATITAHHLLLTKEDARGNPHHQCKPPLKTDKDRRALVDAVLRRDPKFFFGSDTAPHLPEAKLRVPPANGVFSAPVAPQLLLDHFEYLVISPDAAAEILEGFTSVFGAAFYGLPRNVNRIRLRREKWIIPFEYNGIIPMCAGREVAWRLLGRVS